jgi:predicted GTPase
MNYQQQNKNIQNLFSQAQRYATIQQRGDLAEKIGALREQLRNQKLSVVVCGEFKRGKSSLVNALVGVDKLCPVALTIATNLVTEVTYGEVEKITVVLQTRRGEERKEITREQIADYVTEKGNPQNRKQVQSLIIEIPSPLLADGLVLIDTPGIGGVILSQTAVTKNALKFADVVLFVSDTSRPLIGAELKFIQEDIGQRFPHTLFVVTRLDEVGQEKCASIVTSNLEKLSQLSGKSAEVIPIVPVSSRMKLSYLNTGNEEHLEKSNFNALEVALWETIDLYRSQVTLKNALVDLEDFVTQVQLPLLAAKATCAQENQGRIADCLAQIETLESKLGNLLGEDAEWRTALIEGMEELNDDLEVLHNDGFMEISNKIYQYVNEGSDLSNSYAVIQPVSADIDRLKNSLFVRLTERSIELVESLKEATELSLNQAKINQLFYRSPNPQVTAITISRRSDAELMQAAKARVADRGDFDTEDLVGRAGGLLVGSLGMAFTGNPACIPIAMEIGGSVARSGAIAAATAEELEKLKQEESAAGKKLQAAAATQIIQQYIMDAHQSLTDSLEKSLEKVRGSIEKDLNKQIKEAQKTCNLTIKSLTDTANKSQAEIEQKAIELDRQMAPIVQLQQEILEAKVSLG